MTFDTIMRIARRNRQDIERYCDMIRKRSDKEVRRLTLIGRMRVGIDTDDAIDILSHDTGRVYYIDHAKAGIGTDGEELYDVEGYEVGNEQALSYIIEQLDNAETIFAVMRRGKDEISTTKG